MSKKLSALIVGLLLSTHAVADFVVISNKDANFTLDKEHLRKLYLVRTDKLPSGEIPDLYLPSENESRAAFFEEVLDTAERKLLKRYGRVVFSGEGKVPQTLSSIEILNLVRANPTALGVIESGLLDGSVKQLTF